VNQRHARLSVLTLRIFGCKGSVVDLEVRIHLPFQFGVRRQSEAPNGTGLAADKRGLHIRFAFSDRLAAAVGGKHSIPKTNAEPLAIASGLEPLATASGSVVGGRPCAAMWGEPSATAGGTDVTPSRLEPALPSAARAAYYFRNWFSSSS